MAENNEGSAKPRQWGRPFVKGVSGNPGGRPRGISLARTLGDELSEDDARRMIRAAIKAAQQGDMRALALLFERTDGKVPDKHELSGGQQVEVIVRDAAGRGPKPVPRSRTSLRPRS